MGLLAKLLGIEASPMTWEEAHGVLDLYHRAFQDESAADFHQEHNPAFAATLRAGARAERDLADHLARGYTVEELMEFCTFQR